MLTRIMKNKMSVKTSTAKCLGLRKLLILSCDGGGGGGGGVVALVVEMA